MTFWKKKDFESSSEAQPSPVADPLVETPILSPNTDVGESRIEVSSQANAQYLTDKLSKVRSALSAGTVIQGKLSFDTPVRIDGKLSGEVFSTDTLIVGESGVLDAKIDVQNLIVMGKVKGQITVKESVKLMRGAELDGNLYTHSISVEEGAFLNGKCSMAPAKGEKAHTKIITFDSLESEKESETAKTTPEIRPEAH